MPQYYYHYSASSSQHSNNVRSQKPKFSDDSRAHSVVDQVMGDFKADIDMTEAKMHRYPACLGDVDESYSVPRIVSIGPYHHGRDHLKPAEKVKHAAACHCVSKSGRLLEELYGAVVPVADEARHLYDKDVVAGISREDFRHMMFFDACFLVQFMLTRAYTGAADESLNGFLRPNRGDIFHDVMLLENQLPWSVVKSVLSLMETVSSKIDENFVRRKRHCMLPDDLDEEFQKNAWKWNGEYKPPHLLALLRYYIVGRSDFEYGDRELKKIPASVSVVELAKIGITLTANKTTELTDMRVVNKTVFAELSLPPLSLDRDRASYLINMAALELCTVKTFSKAKAIDSAFCSYLLLLAMLVYREEDVHKLREQRILVGGSGLSNTEVLHFLNSFQGLRSGQYYNQIMVQIESYRENRRMRAKLHAFIYQNKRTIAAVVTAIVSAVGIIGTLLSIKQGL
jgi:hypothetical protein